MSSLSSILKMQNGFLKNNSVNTILKYKKRICNEKFQWIWCAINSESLDNSVQKYIFLNRGMYDDTETLTVFLSHLTFCQKLKKDVRSQMVMVFL